MFWTSVAVGSFVDFGVGARLVKTRLPAAVANTPEAIRRERAPHADAGANAPVNPPG